MNFFKYKPTKEEWDLDRKKYLDLFLEEEYGIRPKECNVKLEYKIIEKKIYPNLVIEKIGMYYKDLEMIFYIYMPNKKNKNLRTFIQVIYPYAEENIDIYNDYQSIKNYTPVDEIVKRDFAVIMISCGSVACDVRGGENTGILKAMNTVRTDNSWGVLSSWSYACSKVLDYITTREEFDETKTAVIGHSRGGKTALLTGAIDERFYLIISNDSGNSGAALSRGIIGESIKDIVDRFPYWFCENYKKYRDRESDLPFDQHLLIALQAPRYCYIASASKDEWADPEGEFRSSKLASHFYEIYGVKGLVVPNKIKNDVSYNEGRLAYHCRSGIHDLTVFDWNCYMDYFDKIIKE